jgi:hypothetical protein
MDSRVPVLARPAGSPGGTIAMWRVAGELHARRDTRRRHAADGGAPWIVRRREARRGPDTVSNAAHAAALEDHDA